MGFFERLKNLSFPNQNGNLRFKFPNFINFAANLPIGVEIYRDDNKRLECRFPIKTFGRHIGYNYISINNAEIPYAYIYAMSLLGKKIEGPRVIIGEDKSLEEYSNLFDEFFKAQILDPEYRKLMWGEYS